MLYWYCKKLGQKSFMVFVFFYGVVFMRTIKDLKFDYVPGSYAKMIAQEIKKEKIRKGRLIKKGMTANQPVKEQRKNEGMG